MPRFAAARRLMELGLMPGTEVRFVKAAPLGDPIALEVDGRHLSLRRAKMRLKSRCKPFRLS